MTKQRTGGSVLYSLLGFLAASALPALLLLWRSGELPKAYAQEQNTYKIESNVELVVLHITVNGSHGSPVPDLKESDFKIVEDGVPQEIESFSHDDLPVAMGLVIDNSGSMATKRADVNQAALALVHSSNSQDQVFVVNFNEKVSFGLGEDVPFTSDIRRLRAALSGSSPTGKTALYDAISVGLDHLNLGGPDKKALIVVSDGGDNASTHKLENVLGQAERSNAIIYTVGIFDPDDPEKNPKVLEHLSKSTGGQAFLPESMDEVGPICQTIAADIRNQYTLTYKPTNTKQDGVFRSVRAKVSAHGYSRLSVRARPGYYAPLNPGSSAHEANIDGHSD